VEADAGQLEQVLLNLAVNARDAMPSGGRILFETANVDRATCAAIPELTGAGPFVRVSVADTGTGMDAETQARVFEPFFTTKEPGRGTGLGLATVHGIVQQSGGRLRVRSELGKGTTFEAYLYPAKGQAKSLRAPAAQEAPAVHHSASILLVEDEDSVRRVTARGLRKRGYVVHEARVPSEALRLAADPGFSLDLLLTDVVMPEMSGPDLAAKITAERPAVRVAFISGYSGADLADRMRESGAPHFEKPISAAALAERISEMLGGGRRPE
jgi:CheY-like chemotaxis protein